jgi:hypothetical protein
MLLKLPLRAVECGYKSSLRHPETNLLPISRFNVDELKDAIKSMKSILEMNPPASVETMATGRTQIKHPEAPIFDLRTLNSTQLPLVWSRGVPMVVSHIESRLQGDWGPSYFIDQYGSNKVTIQNCATLEEKHSTVGEFFRTFGTTSLDDRTQILKLKVRYFLCISLCIPKCVLHRTGPPRNVSVRSFPNSLAPLRKLSLTQT